MSKPRLLDLFCGAGGAAMGYHRAGFDVVGVDINPQPHYPFTFVNGDALEFLAAIEPSSFDAIHASPPCQAYTRKAAHWGRARTYFYDHPDLLGPTRETLKAIGLPYVIENVPGAPIDAQIILCGTMFGLKIRKHRLFEASWSLPMPPADYCRLAKDLYNPWQGKGRGAAKHRAAQDTPWIPMAGGASRKLGVTGDVYNAIPPAYTEFIGKALIALLDSAED